MTKQPATKKHSFLFSALPFFIIAHAAHHFLMALEQPLLTPMINYFKVSIFQASAIPSAFAFSSATGQLIAGWFADRYGPTLLIIMDIIGVAVGGILIGISPNYIMLIGSFVFMGIMSGGYHPAATPLISASVDPQIRGRALGFHLVGGNSAFFVSPLIATAVLAGFGDDLGWRYSFIILAVPTIAFGLIFMLYLSKRGGKAHVEAVKQQILEEKPPQPGYRRRITAFLIMMVVGGGIGMSVLPFLNVYMTRTEAFHLSPTAAAGLMAIVFSSGLWAGPVGGYISDKIGSVKMIIITGILSGVIIYLFKWVDQWVQMGYSIYVLYIVLFLQGLNMALRMPVTEVFIMTQAPAKHRSKLFGVYYSTMQYTGAIFAIPGGYFIEKYGFDTMFTVAAIGVTAVAIITAFFIFDAKDHYQTETDSARAG